MSLSKAMRVKQKISLLVQQKDYAQAIRLARSLLQLNSKDIEVWWVLAQLYVQTGGYRDAALAYLQVCQKASPFYLQALERAVNICVDHGFWAIGREPAKALAKAKSDTADAHFCLGLCCFFMSHYLAAIESFERAIAIEPSNVEALNRCGMSYGYVANNEKAQELFRRSLEVRPEGNRASRLMVCSYNYLDGVDELVVYRSHIAEGQALVTSLPKVGSEVVSGQRLRIGICSEDFRMHSVAYFLMPIFKNYDPKKWEIICYSDVAREDAVTREIRSYVDEFRAVDGLSDDALFSQVKDDKIDILIDLMGYFGQSRHGVFARRAARVQLAYLGYPNTTGLAEMDYRLVDKYTDLGCDDFYSEKLLRLEETFICFDPEQGAPEVSVLPAQVSGCITFGAFNSLQKLTESNISLWSDVLNAIPDSRLLVKSIPLNEESLVQSLLARFGRYGIEPSRVDVVGLTPTREDHLRLYSKVDIHLDTFPYNGTTTTCEALWQGVPTLTLAGASHRSRVGLSILHQMGMDDWVVHSEEDFLAVALAHAADIKALAALRKGMRETLLESPLGDGRRFVRALECAFDRVACVG